MAQLPQFHLACPSTCAPFFGIMISCSDRKWQLSEMRVGCNVYQWAIAASQVPPKRRVWPHSPLIAFTGLNSGGLGWNQPAGSSGWALSHLCQCFLQWPPAAPGWPGLLCLVAGGGPRDWAEECKVSWVPDTEVASVTHSILLDRTSGPRLKE